MLQSFLPDFVVNGIVDPPIRFRVVRGFYVPYSYLVYRTEEDNDNDNNSNNSTLRKKKTKEFCVYAVILL